MSLTNARSDCAASGLVIRSVLWSHTTSHVPQTTQEETWLEQHFRATDHSSIVNEQQQLG